MAHLSKLKSPKQITGSLLFIPIEESECLDHSSAVKPKLHQPLDLGFCLWQLLLSKKNTSFAREKRDHLHKMEKSREKEEFQYKNAPKRDQTRETGQASDDQASSKPRSQISAQNHQTSSLQTAFSEVTSALLALLFVSWVDESVGAWTGAGGWRFTVELLAPFCQFHANTTQLNTCTKDKVS